MKKRLFPIISTCVVLTIFTVAFWNFSPKSNAKTRVQLFSLAETPNLKTESEKYSVASIRESEIHFQNNLNDLRGAGELSIPLYDGKTRNAIQNRSEGFESRSEDDFTWRGKIVDGKFSGDVVLTFKNGFVSGLIYSPEGVFEIASKFGKQILIELDQNRYPECAGDINGGEPQNIVEENVGSASDSADRIDVLVVYTPATKAILGGDAQSAALAQQAIDSTNTAYINSKIRQRLRLVHTEEYQYVETASSSADLSALRNNTGIQALRNAHSADLVAMIGELSGACGIGYLMGAVSTGSQNNGFTYTARSCAVGNLSFAHELGHNMGSQHNPENGSNPSFPYGFGHYVNGSYRTVMSYVDPCTSGCTRRPYFSNPAIIFNGVQTGIDNQRDNARSIENTADFIANYRYSGTSLTLSNLNAGDSVPRNLSRTVSWSSNNLTGNVKVELSRDESTNWEILIVSTPNDGSEAINIYGRPTRRARIRVTSLSNPAVSDSSIRNIFIK